MSSENTTSSDRLESIVLRDLESLLRQSIGESVVVVDYKSTSLLPPGENYGSSMLKVEATIKRTGESAEEQLHAVAKMIPPTAIQRSYFRATDSFNKEIFVFEKLIDAYRTIEEESGVPAEHLFDILPKFYGGRLSLKANCREADDDAVVLMENLKTSGYYCADRLKGLDLDHAKLAIIELARFHALGLALKRKKPDLFKEAKETLRPYPFAVNVPGFADVIKTNIDMICSDPRVAQYEERVREKSKLTFDYLQDIEFDEPWETIIHGDFWVNNIMYHKGENDKIDGIKFVDFQMTQASSLMKDLPYFLCTTLKMDVVDNHFEELLDIYYESLIGTLDKTGCDSLPVTRDQFYEQLKKDASDELFHCLMALKVFTHETTDDFDLNSMDTEIFATKGSSLFKERVWRVVSKFVEMEWM